LFGALGDPRFGWVAYLVALTVGLVAGAVAVLALSALA
jgi:hypothetical protein